MKAYVLSLCVGLLVGAIYGVLGVRSPAPPVIALLGLLGMLLGEQGGRAAGVLGTDRDVVVDLQTVRASHPRDAGTAPCIRRRGCAEELTGISADPPFHPTR
jgi:XapX domain-containing protein